MILVHFHTDGEAIAAVQALHDAAIIAKVEIEFGVLKIRFAEIGSLGLVVLKENVSQSHSQN